MCHCLLSKLYVYFHPTLSQMYGLFHSVLNRSCLNIKLFADLVLLMYCLTLDHEVFSVIVVTLLSTLYIERSRKKPSKQDYWSKCTVGVKKGFPICQQRLISCLGISASYMEQHHAGRGTTILRGHCSNLKQGNTPAATLHASVN